MNGQALPRVTVLGASGFVGSALAAALARRPGRLRLVSHTATAVPLDAVADVEVRTCDVAVHQELAEAVADSDVVMYLLSNAGGWRAAAHGGESERVHVGVMRDLLQEWGRGRPHSRPPVLIFAGAASQVGIPPRLPLDGTEVDHPVTVYDEQKLAAECLLLSAASTGAVTGISLRLPTVYGLSASRDLAGKGILAAMMRRAFSDQPLTVWNGGSVERDFVHVTDIAAAFVAALENPARLAGQRWVLGSGAGTPLREAFADVAAAVAEQTGRPPVPVHDLPAPPDAALSDLRSVRIDSSAFRTATGWRPQVSLAAGLRELAAALAGTAEFQALTTEKTPQPTGAGGIG